MWKEMIKNDIYKIWKIQNRTFIIKIWLTDIKTKWVRSDITGGEVSKLKNRCAEIAQNTELWEIWDKKNYKTEIKICEE